MPQDKHEDEMDKIIQSLSDSEGMREDGIDEEWIQNCADLVDEYRRLQRRFLQLEADLSSSESDSSDDTFVL